MKLKVFLLGLSMLVFLFAMNCTPMNKKEFGQFKVGSFEYRSNGLDYAITREGTLQTEVNRANGDITKLSVKWISDCSYQVRMLESTAIYPDSIKEFMIANILTVKILSWSDDFYVFKATSNIADRVMIDTLWIAGGEPVQIKGLRLSDNRSGFSTCYTETGACRSGSRSIGSPAFHLALADRIQA